MFPDVPHKLHTTMRHAGGAPRAQRGFSIVSAVFLIVVMAALGAYMVSIGGVQRTTSVFAAQGARAYSAAQSGLEWGVYQATVNGSCTNPPAFAIGGFTVTVTCTGAQHREKSQLFNVYTITARAEYGAFGSPDYVSRRVEAKASEDPP